LSLSFLHGGFRFDILRCQAQFYEPVPESNNVIFGEMVSMGYGEEKLLLLRKDQSHFVLFCMVYPNTVMFQCGKEFPGIDIAGDWMFEEFLDFRFVFVTHFSSFVHGVYPNHNRKGQTIYKYPVR